MSEHELKTWPLFFDAVATGRKTFDVRLDDRGFAVDDTLVLKEFAPEHPNAGPFKASGSYTGREVRVRVVYVVRDPQWGVRPGYVVLSIEPTDAAAREAVLRAACVDAGLRCVSVDDANWAAAVLGNQKNWPTPSTEEERAIAALRGEEVPHA